MASPSYICPIVFSIPLTFSYSTVYRRIGGRNFKEKNGWRIIHTSGLSPTQKSTYCGTLYAITRHTVTDNVR